MRLAPGNAVNQLIRRVYACCDGEYSWNKYCYILYFIRKLRQLDDENGLNTCQAEISWKRGSGYLLADTPSSWSISQLEHSVRNVAAESEPNHETVFRLSVAIKGT